MGHKDVTKTQRHEDPCPLCLRASVAYLAIKSRLLDEGARCLSVFEHRPIDRPDVRLVGTLARANTQAGEKASEEDKAFHGGVFNWVSG